MNLILLFQVNASLPVRANGWFWFRIRSFEHYARFTYHLSHQSLKLYCKKNPVVDIYPNDFCVGLTCYVDFRYIPIPIGHHVDSLFVYYYEQRSRPEMAFRDNSIQFWKFIFSFGSGFISSSKNDACCGFYGFWIPRKKRFGRTQCHLFFFFMLTCVKDDNLVEESFV